MEEKKEHVKEKHEEKKAEAAEKPKAESPKPKAQSASASAKATADKEPKVKLSKKMEDVIKNVETMSVLELADLVHALEDKFGVSAQAPMAMQAVAAVGAGGAGAQEEEKTRGSGVGDETGEKSHRITTVVWKLAGPELNPQLAMSNELVRMVQSHDDNDQTAQGIKRE